MSTLMTVKEAAEMLHVSKYYIYNLIDTGDLKAYKIGRRYLVMPEDLDAWIQGQAIKQEKRI